MRPSRPVLSFLLLAFATLLSPACWAQLPPAGDTTSPPTPGVGHDYIHAPAETVDPANGSVSVRVPVRIPSGREITIPLNIAYDSAGAFYYGQTVAAPFPHWATIDNAIFSQGGWSYTLPILTHTPQSWSASNGFKNFTCTEAVSYVFQDPTGNRHNLGLAVNTSTPSFFPTCNGTGNSILQGGEGPILATTSQIRIPPVTLTDGNGTVYSFPGQAQTLPTTIVDRNGNTISISTSGTPVSSASVTDTLSRTAVSVGSFGGSPDNISVAGLSSSYQVSWTTASANFTINVVNLPSFLNTPCPASMSGSAKAVSQVLLPNGQKFTLAYDGTYGMLNKMTYPSGGYVRYVWGLAPQEQYYSGAETDSNGASSATFSCRIDYPAITDRYVSLDGSTEVLHQHFAYNTTWQGNTGQWTTKTTTVTTTDLARNTSFTTVYSYSPTGQPCVPDLNPNANNDGCIGNNDTMQMPVEQCIESYDSSGSGGTPPSSCPNLNPSGKLLKTVIKSWYRNEARTLGSVQTVLDNGQSSLTVNCYDLNEQLVETDSYDLGTAASVLPSCANNVPSGTASGPLLRKTTEAYATFTGAHIVDMPSTVITYDGSANRVAETDSYYDQSSLQSTTVVQHGSAPGGSARGNATKVTKQCFVGSTACASGNLSTTFTYYDTGQIYQMTDPNSNVTTNSYTDSYSSCGGSAPPSGASNAYLTKVTYPQTGTVNHIVSYCYDYTSGLMFSSTDQNNLTTSYKSADSLDRLTETDLPDGGKSTYSYNDTPPTPAVTTTKKINSSGLTVTSVAISNGLGAVKQTQLTSDPQGTIYTDTTYDGMGQVYTVSNPYRTGGDPTTSSGTTTYYYDALGRKCLEVPPDGTLPSGGACPTTQPANTIFTTYSGSCTTVTDQTGKSRKSCADGLGRMTQVFEDPAGVNYETDYGYNALGSLLCAAQKGTSSGTFSNCTSIPTGWHPRTFSYDSLSRLLTSNNPETSTVTYKYDSDTNCSGTNTYLGLLVSKTDARGIRTCAQYDALNRGTVLNYSNSDPTITTTYDQSNCLTLSACQNIGQRTSMTDAAGSESWAYQVDATNQRNIHVNKRTTNSITKTSTYYLDFVGNLYQVVYPTNRTVNYTYDAANRPKTAADGSNGITYATDFQTAPTGCLSGAVCYTPQGAFYALSIGQATGFTGLNLTHSYNNRLQPNEFKASSTGGNAIDITYSFIDSVTGHNAGHVNSIMNNLDTTRSQTFTYDSLNRISSALTTSTHATSPTHCWGETYTVDAWGNLNAIAATTNSNYTGCTEESGFSSTADGNNHLPAWAYDASGNATSDGFVTNYQWNAESELKSAAGVNYTYDGDGRRVSKSGGTSKLYWYGSGGNILAETDSSGNTTAEYIFFGGKRVAMLPASGNTQYYVEDLLGTSRVITTNAGLVCYDADFYPYGGERTPYTNNCPATNNYKFEGKERDTETGNDDFGARYYSNRFGRWLSADWSSVPVPVPYANLINPQTLNLYSMVADDPETFADLDGHACVLSAGGDATIDCTGTAVPPARGDEARDTKATNGVQNTQTQDEVKAEADQNARHLDPQLQANIGIGKELVNTVTGLINFLGDASALILGTGTPPKIPELSPSNDLQGIAMTATSIALFAIPGTEETKAPEAVKLAKSLASEAQVAEKGITIAGAGDKEGVVLKKAEKLAQDYGGNPSEWSKKSSTAYSAADGSKISTHWYELVGSAIKYELKTIIDSAPWKRPVI